MQNKKRESLDGKNIVLGVCSSIAVYKAAELASALSRLGVEAAQAVYVGDTDIDMKTAAAAGVRGIGVTTGNFSAEQHNAAGAWRVCGSLAEAAALCGVEPRK